MRMKVIMRKGMILILSISIINNSLKNIIDIERLHGKLSLKHYIHVNFI